MESLNEFIVTIPRPASTRCKLAIAAGIGVLLMAPGASAQDLSSYAILAGSTITNTGITTINGNIGLSPGTSFTGQGPGANAIVQTGGVVNIANSAAVQAKSDLTTAFNVLMGRPSTALVGDLGEGRVLSAGVYSYASSAQLTGTLTLNGGPDAIFIIKVGSSLTTATDSEILLAGGAQASNVFFVVGESVTLGTSTDFVGQILAGTSISLNTFATILCGAALTQTGAVTLDTNTINICTFTTDPEEIAELLGDDITDTGGSIIDAIDDFVEGGGDLPLSVQLLALLSPTELADALEQLSGELGTEVAPAGMQSMDSFLDLIGGGYRGTRALLSPPDEPQAGGTISVMGYAPGRQDVAGGAFDSFDAPGRTPRDGQWTAWISSYGGQSWTTGDADDGSHSRAAASFGVALGFERQVDTATTFGFALSGGGTSFEVADDLGSGRSAMLQAAVYARSDFDQAYLSGALAAGVHRVSLDRVLTFAGKDHFTADFNAASFAGEIEAGYKIGWFTPYAALRGQAFATPAYSEETASGSSIFALDYEANTALSLRTELGARVEWSTEMGDAGQLTLHASAAWAHDFRKGETMNASFQSLPGSTFTVNGATPAADSLLASAGVDFELGSGVALSGTVSGKATHNALDYGATGGLSYSW